MKFYKISDDSGEHGYVYASGYGPLEHMPFLPSAMTERRKKYWEINPEPPGLHIEKGRKRVWPDFLHNGFSPPSYFLSEKVIQDLNSIHTRFKRLTEMPIAVTEGKWHKKNSSPKYFVVEAEPGIQVDFEASGYKFDSSGKPLLPALYRPAFPKDVFKKKSWNGSDLFSQHYFGIMGSLPTALLCTEKVKELAEDNGWINVHFEEVEVV